MKRRVEFVTARPTALLCVLLLACAVKGDRCTDVKFKCGSSVIGEAKDIGTHFHDRHSLSPPPNLTALDVQCQMLWDSVSTCLEEVLYFCPGEINLSASLNSMQDAYNSVCGLAPICRAKMARCQSSFRTRTDVDKNQRMGQLCRVQKARRDCILRDMDRECLSLPEIKPAIKALNASLGSRACSDEGRQQCPQLRLCLNPQSDEIGPECSWPAGRAKCIGDLRDQCHIKEKGVSFQQVESVAEQFCQEVTKADVSNRCRRAVDRCLSIMGTVYVATKARPSANINVTLLLDSKTWCQSLLVVVRCYVVGGRSCRMDPDLLSFMTSQRDCLVAMCNSSYDASSACLTSYDASSACLMSCGPVGNTVLVLLMAVLTLGLLITGSTLYSRFFA